MLPIYFSLTYKAREFDYFTNHSSQNDDLRTHALRDEEHLNEPDEEECQIEGVDISCPEELLVGKGHSQCNGCDEQAQYDDIEHVPHAVEMTRYLLLH